MAVGDVLQALVVHAHQSTNFALKLDFLLQTFVASHCFNLRHLFREVAFELT